MIASLNGILAYKSIDHIIVDIHGVGYEVVVPLSVFYKLPDIGRLVELVIHTHVSQDLIKLFGFTDNRGKDLFRLLISVGGIGPRLAINILSGISPEELSGAISGGNLGRLVSIPGVGKKTAERMIFELKEKIAKLSNESSPNDISYVGVKDDALSALINLGYRNNVAKEVIDRIYASKGDSVTLEVLLPEALKVLSA